MDGIKRKSLLVLAAALVTACFNGCGGNAGGVPEETAATAIAQITETAPEISETPETKVSETETSAETETETKTEGTSKRLLTPPRAGHDPRTGDYLAALAEEPDFVGKWVNCCGVVVADVNGDGVPEVFLQQSAMGSLTEVFTVVDGKTVHFKAASDSYSPSNFGTSYSSYDGNLPEFYVRNGEMVILAECCMGGSVAGNGGVMEISFDGESISTKEVCGYSYSKDNLNIIYYYSFGGKDVTEEEYRSCLDDYMSELDYCADYSVTVTNNSLLCNSLVPLADALDGFYGSLGKGEGLDFDVELKPIYVSRDDYAAEISYDYMGNISSIKKHYKDVSLDRTDYFKYIYDDNGEVTQIYRNTKDYEVGYVPNAAFDWNIDYYGNIQKTRSNYPYTDMDGSLYKAVTDEQGRVLEETFFADERFAEIYSYNGVKAGDIQSRCLYRYDNFGNRIYEELDTELYAANDAVQDYVKTWEYDGGYRLVKDVYSYWGHDVINEYFYNEAGDMVKRIHTFTGGDDDMNGRKEGVYVTDYSYGKNLKGGVTYRHGSGSDHYYEYIIEYIIEDIYYAPVRTVRSK